MFALSLSWNTCSHKKAEFQIREVARIGFKAVELPFSLREKKLKSTYLYCKKYGIKITSIHNYCPIPGHLPVRKAFPDSYSLSSLKEAARRMAVFYTKRTIDTAVSVKAKAVVIHAGRVLIEDTCKEMMRLACLKGSQRKLTELKRAMLEQRNLKKRDYLEATFKSVEELSGYSLKKGIKLGIENRVYLPEIPALEEFDRLLKLPNTYLWFDTGHAFINEKLWGIKSRRYLDLYGEKLLGLHLHDVSGMKDHRAPGTGEFDFHQLKPFIKRSTMLVIEAHSPSTAEEIKKSISILDKALK